MENKNPFRVYQPQNNKYKVETTDYNIKDDESPQFQVYESLDKQTQVWPLRSQLLPVGHGHEEETDSFFNQRVEKKRSLTDDGTQFKPEQNRLLSSMSQNTTTAETNSSNQKNAFNIKISKQPQQAKDSHENPLETSSFMFEESKDESLQFVLIEDFQEKLFYGTLDQQQQDRKHLEFQKDIKTSNMFEDLRGSNSSNSNQRKSEKESLTSQLKEWGINLKYHLVDNKPKNTLGMFFSYPKVTFDKEDCFPILLLHRVFMLDRFELQYQKNQTLMKNQILEKKKEFLPYFYSVIWVTYRKNFKKLLSEDFKLVAHVENNFGQQKLEQALVTTDCNWGCTIRVGQMMMTQALSRILIGEDNRLDRVVKNKQLSSKYKFILNLIQDNDESRTGAFSIQNFAKMALAHSKLPGEWYGPNAVSMIFKDLNKLYQPLDDFQVCLFNDGNVYLDKIQRLATKRRNLNYLKNNKNEEQDQLYSKIEFIFLKQIRQMEAELKKKNLKQPTTDYENQQNLTWRNNVLVIIPVRLGLNKINKEYYKPILQFFQCPLNVGIIGGKPGQAFYFVGSQKSDLLFLDPHFVQQSIESPQDLISEHLTYHCPSAKKLNIQKLDTSLAFGFMLKDRRDFQRFEAYMKEGRKVHQENWLFSIFDKKPTFMMEAFIENSQSQVYQRVSNIGMQQNYYSPQGTQIKPQKNHFLPTTVHYTDEQNQRQQLVFDNSPHRQSSFVSGKNKPEFSDPHLQSKKLDQADNSMVNDEEDDFELV